MCDLFKMPEKPVSKQRKRGKSNKAGQRLSRERKKTHQNVLCELIDVLTSSKVMAFPNIRQSFVLHTDASQDGLGAIFIMSRLVVI